MKKICFSNPLKVGHFGDTTRVVEFWNRIPRLLNTTVYIFTQDDEIPFSNREYYMPIRLRTRFFGKRIRYVSRVISHFLVVLHTLLISDLACVYEIQTTLNITGLLISRIKNVPLVYEVNSIIEYEKRKTFFNNIIITIGKLTEKWTVNHAKKITVVTMDLKTRFCEEYSIPPNKIEIVPNGANIDLFYPMDKNMCRRKLNLCENSLIVCFVGGMGLGCGAQNIVESAEDIIKHVPNTTFLIVGDGAYKSKMEEKIGYLELKDKFVFTGVVDNKEVPFYINSSDVCIALFKGERIKKVGGGSSIKTYEYMACAKPVVGTKDLSTFEVLVEHNAGLVADSTDPQSISRTIVKLLKNKEFREKLGKNGRKLVEERYNWEVIAKQVATICNEVCKHE